jgi:hypothetical protein
LADEDSLVPRKVASTCSRAAFRRLCDAFTTPLRGLQLGPYRRCRVPRSGKRSLDSECVRKLLQKVGLEADFDP